MDKTIVVLCGEMNSGKGSVGQHLKQFWGFVPMSFASTLKDVIAYVYGLPRELLEGDTAFSRQWREVPHPALGNKTPREALQVIGTEGFRGFYSETWINALIRSINTSEDSLIVITDCRFENELKALKKLGATVLFIERPQNLSWIEKLIRPLSHLFRHSSEQAWRLKPYADKVIVNDSGLDELFDRAEKALDLPQFNQLELDLALDS